MSDDEKRQVLYAALVLHEPASAPLRERALDRLVLTALLGSTLEHPYKFGAIENNLLANGMLRIRDEYIHETLNRLHGRGQVDIGEIKLKKTYSLTTSGSLEIDATAGAGAQLFDRVLRRVLANTAHLVEHTTAKTVVRKFLSECFARFGRSIAQQVIGGGEQPDNDHRIDSGAAFDVATAGCGLTVEACDSLRVRCNDLLTSTEPDDERLRFALTQGYYFAQLLGAEPQGFSPLAEHAFADSTFFIDTNVIFAGLLSPGYATSAQIDELFLIAKRVGIDLRVTRATINEARRAAVQRKTEVARLADSLPESILQRAFDPVLRAFLIARQESPDLTVDAFFLPFENLPEAIGARWGISLDDVVEDELLARDELPKVAEQVRRASERIRKRSKRDAAIRHDVAHYQLVKERRSMNSKTWFLTRDRTLVAAAGDLAIDGIPFCFSLAGFLQSISPFVQTAEQAYSLADLFAAVITDQVFTEKALFETRELMVLAEMHEDVHASTPEQLVKAFDAVRATAEKGKEFTAPEKAVIALEIRKHLAATATTRHRTLTDNIDRLEREKDAERRHRQKAEADREVLLGRMTELERRLNATVARQADMTREGANLRSSVRDMDLERRIALSGLGLMTAALLWFAVPSITDWLGLRSSAINEHRGVLSSVLSLLGFAIGAISVQLSTTLIRNSNVRVGVETLCFASLLYLSSTMSDETASRAANLVQIAAALVLLGARARTRQRPAREG